jgi:hypothetical protein
MKNNGPLWYKKLWAKVFIGKTRKRNVMSTVPLEERAVSEFISEVTMATYRMGGGDAVAMYGFLAYQGMSALALIGANAYVGFALAAMPKADFQKPAANEERYRTKEMTVFAERAASSRSQ